MRRPQPWSRLIFLFLSFGFLFSRSGLLVLAGVLIVTIAIAWLWNKTIFNQVHYDRKLHYTRGFPGENIACSLLIENRKILPLGWLDIRDKWPWAVGPDHNVELNGSDTAEAGFLRMLFTMRSFHKIRRDLEISLRKRGVYLLGPAEAISGDPFGFFENRQELGVRQQITVFPTVRKIQEIGFNPDDPFGLSTTRRRLYYDATRPAGVRDYQPQDGFRHIHWPATARVGELQTRVFQPISGLDLIICLNVATFEPHWRGVWPALLETLLQTAASIAHESFGQGFRVGLISNGGVAHAGRTFRIPPGRSPRHLPHLLEALAGLQPIVSGPFDRFLLREAPRLEYGSTLIIVTGVMPASLREAIARLGARNRKIILISLAKQIPQFIPQVEIIHQPFVEKENPA